MGPWPSCMAYNEGGTQCWRAAILEGQGPPGSGTTAQGHVPEEAALTTQERPGAEGSLG